MLYVGSGQNLVALDSASGLSRWTFLTSSTVYSSPAVGIDGTVYVCDLHNLYAINGATGVLRWSYAVSGSIYGSPAIGSDGTIYFGEYLDSATKGKFFAVLSSGTLKWSINTAAIVSSAAVGPNGIIYVGSDDNAIYALNPADGSTVNSFLTDGYIQSAPAIGPDGKVYVYSGDGSVYAFTPNLGYRWSYNTGSSATYSPQFVSSPGIGPDGSIYVGTSFGTFISISSTGQLNWTFQNGSTAGGTQYTIQSSVAIGADGTIYLGASDTNVYALSTNGQVKWKVNVTNSNQASPALAANGTLYVAASTGIVAFSSVVPASISLNPTKVSGGLRSEATLTLSGAAPSGGLPVLLATDDPSVSVPGSITIAGGQSSVTFSVQTTPVVTQKAVNISGAINGVAVKTTLTVTPASLLSVSATPTQVTGGNQAQGTVTLTSPAPVGGVTISLTSHNSALTVPASVTIASGSLSAPFTINTSGVSALTTVTVTASLASAAKTVSISVLPATLVGLTFSPSTVVGPASSVATVTLNGSAPLGGVLVTLKSSNKAATVPTSVKVPAGNMTATFTVKTSVQSKAVVCLISGSYQSTVVTAGFEVDPLAIMSLALNPETVSGGASSMATVTLNGVAPSPGVKVSLRSLNTIAAVPVNVLVPTGLRSARFNVSTKIVSASTPVQISSTLGSSSANATLTVTPSELQAISLSSSTIPGGQTVTGTVALSGPAGQGGISVSLKSDNPAASVVSSVTIADGQSSASFTVQTTTVDSDVSVVITAHAGAVTCTAPLLVSSLSLSSVSMNPSSTYGGMGVIGVVTLSGFAPPGGVKVSLNSNSSSVEIPDSVTIPSGRSAMTFVVLTAAVSTETVATINATYGLTVSTQLRIAPAFLTAVTVVPTSIHGGTSARGTVKLNGLAPNGGFVITLSSSDRSASVPLGVTVPAGQSSVTFPVKTSSVRINLNVVITAKDTLGHTAKAKVTIQP